MFDVGWSEMLVIAVVLIVVVGPKDLPRMLRTFGKTTSRMRQMAGEFRKQFDEALKEAELDDVKTLASDVNKLNPASDIKKALNPIEKAAQDVRAGFDAAMKPQAKPDTSAEPAAPGAIPAEPLKNGPDATPGGAAEQAAPAKNGHDRAAARPSAKAKPKASAPAKSASSSQAKPKAAAKPAPAKKAAPGKTAGKATGKTGGKA